MTVEAQLREKLAKIEAIFAGVARGLRLVREELHDDARETTEMALDSRSSRAQRRTSLDEILRCAQDDEEETSRTAPR